MLAPALLLAALEAPPALVRAEATETAVIGDAPAVVTGGTLETALAADGSFSLRVTDGPRTRTLEGRVSRAGGRFLVRVAYRDATVAGWVPTVGGGRAPVVQMSSAETTVSVAAVGERVPLGGGLTATRPAGGAVERVTREVALTLLPRGGSRQRPGSARASPRP